MKKRILNYLYSGHLFCTDEEPIKHKFVFLNSVMSVTILITFVMGIYRYLHDNEVVSTIDFSFALLAALLLLMLRRDKSHIEAIATALLAAAFLLFLTLLLYASVQSTRLSVFFLLVASAFYLKGIRIGNYWLIAVMLCIGIVHFSGFAYTGYSNLDIFATYIYLFSFYIILRLYESVKASQTHSLIELNNNLEELVNQRTEELYREKELLRIASITDPLTRLYNRNKMDEVFADEERRSTQEGNDFSIILVDLDHFKRVNDTYGHNVGDLFLKEIAELLGNAFRESDTIGRWGGEEFLIFLPNTHLNEAMERAERLREIVARHPFSHIGSQSASLGVATLKSGETLKSLIHRADSALYEAKKNGRNRVQAAS